MGCCGNQRAAAAVEDNDNRPRRSDVRPTRPTENPEVYFKYTGKTALRVQGIFTRRVYYFKHTGAVLPVSGRDAPSMKAVPMLKPVPMG